MTRVSTALFIGQLTRHPPRVQMSSILAGTAGVWAAASILTVTLRGELSQPWTVMDGTQTLVQCNLLQAPGDSISDLLVVLQMDCR
jgi:hypothetical protein